MSPFFFFFQKYWNIVGDDITEVILYVLSLGHLLHKMNCTHIFFIPKINKPQTVADYRLINLVNVISRKVSKVLSNWLKLILLNAILDSQSVFVSNRLITNNTTIAFEG